MLYNAAFRGKVLAISHMSMRSANRTLYRSLRRCGIDVELIVPSRLVYDGLQISAEPGQADDPPIHILEPQWRNLRLLRYRALTRFLAAIRPNVIVAEADTASLLALETGRWCRRNGAKLICRTNENLSWNPLASIARGGLSALPHSLLKCAVNRLNAQNVSAVCVTSFEALRLFQTAGFQSPVNIPLGTDRVRFRYSSRTRYSARQELGLQAGETVVSYFGRLVPEKGVDLLIDALCRLTAFKWRLLLNSFQTASAYSKDIHKRLVRGGIAERTNWIRSKHGELARYFAASDITVLPSRTTPKWVEQFGRVVPEAMACGNLVIVSDSGTPKELVGHSGLVFPEGDASALEQTLRNALSDPADCLARRKAAIRHVHRNLQVDIEAQHYIELFKNVVST